MFKCLYSAYYVLLHKYTYIFIMNDMIVYIIIIILMLSLGINVWLPNLKRPVKGDMLKV